MRTIHRAVIFAIISVIYVSQSYAKDDDKSLMWLEEIEGEKALTWVRAQNEATLDELTKDPLYEEFKQQAYDILTASDRITYGSLRGGYVYNFWRDKEMRWR